MTRRRVVHTTQALPKSFNQSTSLSIDGDPVFIQHRVREVLPIGAVEGACRAGYCDRLARLHPKVVQRALDPPHLHASAAPPYFVTQIRPHYAVGGGGGGGDCVRRD